MLSSKLLFTFIVIQILHKGNQVTPTSKRNSAYIRLSKLHCECVSESFCHIEQCFLKPVRRNEAQVFFNVSIFQRPITNCKINIDLYRKYTVYNSFPFNVTWDMCSFLKNTRSKPIMYNIYQMFVNASSFNHTCPYYEKNLLVQNLTARYTEYFSFVPAGSYMAKTRWITDGIVRIILTIWIELQNPDNIMFPEGF